MIKGASSGPKLVLKYIKKVFPLVHSELNYWNEFCTNVSDSELKTQALSSISIKKFHALGGSIYSLYPNTNLNDAIKFITSIQTISDYLDNLCDRMGISDEIAFKQLHLSLLNAIDPSLEIDDYYCFYPFKNDSDYLLELVMTCRELVTKLPSYHIVIDSLKNYVELYSKLQAFKHLDVTIREKKLIDFSNKYLKIYPDVQWWEFCAAAGSTLGIFVLYVSAYNENLTSSDVDKLNNAYFPWICGLHILLDYYIDTEEDIETNDLNFTSYYNSTEECLSRLEFFIRQSLKKSCATPYAEFHFTVVKGLLAMYLSDPKACKSKSKKTSLRLIKEAGLETEFYFYLCRVLRLSKKI